MCENLLLSYLKMHHFKGILPKWVMTPQNKISSHIPKMACTDIICLILKVLAWKICSRKKKCQNCIIQAQWQNIFTIFLSRTDVIRGNKVSKLYKFMTFYHKFTISSIPIIIIPQRWFQITFRILSNSFKELRQFIPNYLASNLFHFNLLRIRTRKAKM